MKINNYGYYEQLLYYAEYDSTENDNNSYCKIPVFGQSASTSYLSIFRDKYNLERFFSPYESILINNLLCWTYEVLLQPLYIENTISFSNSIDLIETAKKEKKCLNCYCHAYVLRDALQCFNIKSRIVYCLPINCDYYGNHVVVEYFSLQNNCWVLLDPTYNLILTDDAGHMLNLLTLRQNIINSNPVRMISIDRFGKISNNNVPAHDRLAGYINMMIPIMVVLQYENIDDDGYLEYRLIPKRYLLPKQSVVVDNTIYISDSKLLY